MPFAGQIGSERFHGCLWAWDQVSSIEGEFEGWDGDTTFKLDNGQIWQQVGYAYSYHYKFRPKVIIIKTRGTYKLKVDGVESTIFVKRIK